MLTDNNIEHPQVTHTLRTGYPQSPFSHCNDVSEISRQCSKCGTVIAEEQSKYGLCEVCEMLALEKFVHYLCNEFDNAEREYIGACTEGVSLTEPNKFKINKEDSL